MPIKEKRKNLKEWKERVQQVYSSLEEFEEYNELYGIVDRINATKKEDKYESAEDMWDANPVLSGSTKPSDLKFVKETKSISELKNGSYKGKISGHIFKDKEGNEFQLKNGWKNIGWAPASIMVNNGEVTSMQELKEGISSGVIMRKADEVRIEIKKARRAGRGEEVDAIKARFSRWLADNGVYWKTSPYAVEILEETKGVNESIETLSKYSVQLKAINSSIIDFIKASSGDKLSSTTKEAVEDLFSGYHKLKNGLLKTKVTFGEHSSSVLASVGKKKILDADEVSNTQLESLLKKHLENNKKLSEIDAKIDALNSERAEFENTTVDEQIMKMLSTMENKMATFGNIVAKLNVSKEKYTTKVTYSYKNIIDKILETYEIETKFINKLYKEFMKGGETKFRTDKELVVFQEKKQLQEASILSFIKSLYKSFLEFIKSDYQKYSKNISELEKIVS